MKIKATVLDAVDQTIQTGAATGGKHTPKAHRCGTKISKGCNQLDDRQHPPPLTTNQVSLDLVEAEANQAAECQQNEELSSIPKDPVITGISLNAVNVGPDTPTTAEVQSREDPSPEPHHN